MIEHHACCIVPFENQLQEMQLKDQLISKIYQVLNDPDSLNKSDPLTKTATELALL